MKHVDTYKYNLIEDLHDFKNIGMLIGPFELGGVRGGGGGG